MSWVVDNLNSALGTWNDKLAEIWTLLTQEAFPARRLASSCRQLLQQEQAMWIWTALSV